jgi:hypothetical protein
MSKNRGFRISSESLVLERGVSKASQRITRAVELGVFRWQKKRRRSSKKKRDGALRDAIENGLFAAGVALKEASWAPGDLFKPLGPKRDPRLVLVRALLPFTR